MKISLIQSSIVEVIFIGDTEKIEFAQTRYLKNYLILDGHQKLCFLGFSGEIRNSIFEAEKIRNLRGDQKLIVSDMIKNHDTPPRFSGRFLTHHHNFYESIYNHPST